jgi:hypothetical protein
MSHFTISTDPEKATEQLDGLLGELMYPNKAKMSNDDIKEHETKKQVLEKFIRSDKATWDKWLGDWEGQDRKKIDSFVETEILTPEFTAEDATRDIFVTSVTTLDSLPEQARFNHQFRLLADTTGYLRDFVDLARREPKVFMQFAKTLTPEDEGLLISYIPRQCLWHMLSALYNDLDNTSQGNGDSDRHSSERKDGKRETNDADEQKADEQDANKQDANKQDANKQDANKQDANKQDANKQDANKQDTKTQDTKTQESTSSSVHNYDNGLFQNKGSKRAS